MDNIKKKKTKKKIKKLPKISNEIVVIKNKDKQNHEAWSSGRSKDISNFPSPCRIVLLGGVGKGKTNLLKNLILHKSPMFDEIVLCHPDIEHSHEYDDLDVSDKIDEIPDLSYFNYDDDPKKRRLLIIDDMEFEAANKQRLKNLAILFRYGSSHKGLSIYFSHQNFFSVPTIVKKLASVFIIWKPTARNELTLIENRVGMPKGSLKHLFKTVASGHRDSICIDMSENTPAPLRLNLWKILKPVQSSSDEDEDESVEDD